LQIIRYMTKYSINKDNIHNGIGVTHGLEWRKALKKEEFPYLWEDRLNKKIKKKKKNLKIKKKIEKKRFKLK